MTTSGMPRLTASNKVHDMSGTGYFVESRTFSLPCLTRLSIPGLIKVGKMLLTYNIQHILIMKNYKIRMVSQKIHTQLLHAMLTPSSEI